MNLQEFKSLDVKPWLRVAGDISVFKTSLQTAIFTSVGGGGVATLTAEQLCSGILVILAGRSSSVGLPLTAAIDAYLGIAQDGIRVTLDVINREPTNTLSMDSAEISAQNIPKAQSGVIPTTSRFIFIRVAGQYVCLNQ